MHNYSIIANIAEPTHQVCLKRKLKSESENTDFNPKNKDSLSAQQTQLVDESDTASEEGEETVITKQNQAKPELITSNGLASLNRAQMERERVQRLNRVTKQTLEAPTIRPTKRIRLENVHDNESIDSKTSVRTGFEYPEGMIKWTHVVGYPKEPHHITIQEVLQKNTLQAAVLSGFQVLSSS